MCLPTWRIRAWEQRNVGSEILCSGAGGGLGHLICVEQVLDPQVLIDGGQHRAGKRKRPKENFTLQRQRVWVPLFLPRLAVSPPQPSVKPHLCGDTGEKTRPLRSC